MMRVPVLALALAVGCRTAPPPPAPPPADAPPPEASRPDDPQAATPPDAPPGGVVEQLRELRRRVADLAGRAEELRRQAHEALDRGAYEDAASRHQESLAAAREADQARAGEDALVTAAAKRHLEDLDHDEIARRDEATRALIDLGAPPDRLRELGRNLSPEASRRLELVLRALEVRIHPSQWATTAKASSEYSGDSYSAKQATGPPNTPVAGDHPTAWASQARDGGLEWLEVAFEHAVEATFIRVHETYNAGAICKVEARDAAGTWRMVWEGPAGACETPRRFEVPVAGRGWTTREVRITLDSAAVDGWNEIDAVELVGRRPVRGARR